MGEPDPQWQQPPFQGAAPQDVPVESPVTSGSLIVPREPRLPPSVAETVVKTVRAVLWPALILLAIMGVVDWWPAMFVTMLATIILSNVGRHLKEHRKATARGELPPNAR